MTVTLGDIVTYIRADDSKAQGDLRGFENRALSTITGIGKKVAIAVGAAAVGAGVAAVGLLASTIEPASDLSETINKTSEIFKDSSAVILDWSKTASTSVGLSQQAALDAASMFGVFGKSAQLAGNDLINFSKDNLTLAADLASFFNTSVEDAAVAMQAAFRGETEPIRKYGILLDDASMRQAALRLGIISTTKEALTPQQKVLAAQALIWEQTKDAQGDFARTSDGLANSQRILQARMEDLKATVGTALLPVVTKFVGMLNEFLAKPEVAAFIERITAGLSTLADAMIQLLDGDVQGALTTLFGSEAAAQIMPTLQAISDWITNTLIPFVQEHAPAIKTVLIGIGAALAAAGIIAIVLGIASAIASLANPVGIIIAAIGLLAAAWTGNWGGIQEKTMAVINFIRPFFQAFVDWMLGLWNYWAAQFKAIFELFSLAFQGKWYEFGAKLREIWDRAWAALREAASKAWENIRRFFTETDWGSVGRAILSGIANGITAGLSFIRDAAINAANAALEAAKGFLGIQSPSSVFAEEVGEPSAEGFGQGFAKKMGQIGAGTGASALGAGMNLAGAGAGVGGTPIQINVYFDKPLTLYDERQVEQQLAPVFERLYRKQQRG